jgi:hypothetical protein
MPAVGGTTGLLLADRSTSTHRLKSRISSSVPASECSKRMYSGLIERLVIRQEVLRMRSYLIPCRDHLLVCLQYLLRALLNMQKGACIQNVTSQPLKNKRLCGMHSVLFDREHPVYIWHNSLYVKKQSLYMSKTIFYKTHILLCFY